MSAIGRILTPLAVVAGIVVGTWAIAHIRVVDPTPAPAPAPSPAPEPAPVPPPVPVPTPTPRPTIKASDIRVIDLDATTPHHLIVLIEGEAEPFRVVSHPAGDPSPSPVPPPGPVPPPAPTPDPVPPVDGVLWVTYIEPATPTVADTLPKGHPAITALRKPGSVEWREQAVGDAEIARRKLEAYAKDAPVTLYQDAKGKVIATLKGNDPQAIADKIKAMRGAK